MTTTHTGFASIGTPETLDIADLNLHHANPRRGNVEAIAASMAVNGVYKPLVVNRGTHTGRPMEVLAGNHSLRALRLLTEQQPDETRWRRADCWIVDVDDDRATRIVLADNRTADLGDYDERRLAAALESLDGDLDGTGYDLDDLADLSAALDGLDDTGELTGDPDEAPPPPANPLTQPGDVVIMGRHRLWCGDATDTTGVLEHLLGDERADCVWTDPPYGVSYVGKTSDALTIHNDGADGLADLLSRAFTTITTATRPGAPVYVAHADTERATFEAALVAADMPPRQNLIWVKNTFALGRADYHWRHEPILYAFTPGGEGRCGRGGEHWYGDNAQSTVFEYDKPSRNADHPTMKPVDLIADMLSNSCRRGGIVLDIFAGSGSVLVAAEKLGMSSRLVELDPTYADVIARRWQTLTGHLPHVNGQPRSFSTEGDANEG